MLIKEVSIVKVTLPFAREFSHSMRKRLSVTNVFVLLKNGDGRILGCGEGAPRSYVTGETPDSMISHISNIIKYEKFPWEFQNPQQLYTFLDSLPVKKEMNASICALEMALLDSYARGQKRQVIDFFPREYYSPSIIYGAAIPLGTEDVVKNACQTINALGLTSLKLKIGKDYSQNESLFKIIIENISNEYDLKVDVNGVWDKDTAIRHIPMLSKYGVKVIEQPMAPNSIDIRDFSRMVSDNNMILMADESACSLGDMEKIVSDGYYGMVNVRVSKCGGLRRSLRIIEYLRSMGIPFQIGCQLGESGILSAAGRILSLLCRDAVSYEGSYDKLLLAENVTKIDVSFGYGGIAYPLDGIGLGADIDPVKIDRLSEHSSIRNFQKL